MKDAGRNIIVIYESRFIALLSSMLTMAYTWIVEHQKCLHE
jgi:hypothetical protein